MSFIFFYISMMLLKCFILMDLCGSEVLGLWGDSRGWRFMVYVDQMFGLSWERTAEKCMCVGGGDSWLFSITLINGKGRWLVYKCVWLGVWTKIQDSTKYFLSFFSYVVFVSISQNIGDWDNRMLILFSMYFMGPCLFLITTVFPKEFWGFYYIWFVQI